MRFFYLPDVRPKVTEDVRELVQGWLAPPVISWRQVLQKFIGSAGRIGR
ncbi:MAG: hypothetical protein ACSLFH_17595 [Desulfuromonadales bacterium]